MINPQKLVFFSSQGVQAMVDHCQCRLPQQQPIDSIFTRKGKFNDVN
jgi:hypothetical protein